MYKSVLTSFVANNPIIGAGQTTKTSTLVI